LPTYESNDPLPGFIAEDQAVTARIKSRPQDEFAGRVVRIGLESDRVTEERRVNIRGDNPPPRVYLGEETQAFRLLLLLAMVKSRKAQLRHWVKPLESVRKCAIVRELFRASLTH